MLITFWYSAAILARALRDWHGSGRGSEKFFRQFHKLSHGMHKYHRQNLAMTLADTLLFEVAGGIGSHVG